MAQQYKIGHWNTTITKGNEKTKVTLYETDVISWDAKNIKLNSGGWRTQTTKNRINQASNEYGLGIKVYQFQGIWYVKNNNSIGCNNRILPFKDGMIIEWNPGRV